MAMNQIICIGNRLVEDDAAGLAVYDRLKSRTLPDNIKIVEGGLAGLNLLPLLETGGRVVFVDAVSGFTSEGNIVILDQQVLLKETSNPAYGHGAGLPYLLTILPHVCEGKLPEEITLVGLEGRCRSEVIDKAVALSVEIATGHWVPDTGEAHA